MMKSKKLLALLGLALTLGITSCKDNDLSDGTNGGNPSGQVTEQNYQKYEALQTLLGVVASVDSLPQNWDTNDYAEEPTIGIVKDASNPYVRYVVTTSAEEADREFRSMISQGTDGTAKSSTWKQDGVGSLDFKVLNQTDCYATLDVNVQQLPHLTQLRFVPASVIGENKIIKPYYQFGDVLKQTIGEKIVYWVCVRPCDKSKNLGQSHWCTLQLLPKDVKNSNYKKINDELYLPTDLGSNKGESQRMVQNFFNVLRIMANPEVYNQNEVAANKRVGLDKISYEEFTYEQAKKASGLWEDYGIWNLLPNDGFKPGVLKKMGNNEPSSLMAYYYGYNKVWIGKGDYTTYYLDISNNPEEGKLFNVVTPQTDLVYADNPKTYTFYEIFGVGNVSNSVDDKEMEQIYIVKHRTGSDLVNSWLHNDPDPEATSAGKNGIEEILASNSVENNVEEKSYFTYGDVLSASALEKSEQICIKPSLLIPNSDLADNKMAIFFAPKADMSVVNQTLTLSDKCKAAILYQIAASYAENVGNSVNFPEIQTGSGLSTGYNINMFNGYAGFLARYIKSDFYKVDYNHSSDKLTIKAKFYNEGTYELEFYTNGEGDAVLRNVANDEKLKALPLIGTKDVFGQDKFSQGKVSFYLDNDIDRISVTKYINESTNKLLNRLQVK